MKIKIGSMKYDLRYRKNIDDSKDKDYIYFGIQFPDSQKIFVKSELPLDSTQYFTMHEICHAIDDQLFLFDGDETKIGALAMMLTNLLVDNRKFFRDNFLK